MTLNDDPFALGVFVAGFAIILVGAANGVTAIVKALMALRR